MKKRFAAAGTGLAAGALAAVMAMNAFAAQITEDKAKSIALEHAGRTSDQVTYIRSLSGSDDGWMVYDVKFLTADYKEYDYEINAADGMILSVEYEAKAPAAYRNNSAPVSLDRAKELCLEHAGQKADNVTFVKLENEYEHGRTVYDIDFCTADYKEYKYEVNGNTGEITGWEYDIKKSLSQNAADGASQQTGAVSGIEAAKAIAVKQAGLNLSDVAWGEVETDYEDGRMIYEGKFFHGTMEYEFEIDAATGQVRKWEMESMYD